MFAVHNQCYSRTPVAKGHQLDGFQSTVNCISNLLYENLKSSENIQFNQYECEREYGERYRDMLK